MSSKTQVRAARQQDLPQIMQLLASCNLPTEGVADLIADLLVGESDEQVIGVIGLEPANTVGLLRSLVVDSNSRGAGVATRLCDALEARASQNKIRALYLLTETAESFFQRRGYLVIERAEAPAEIAATDEFSSLCPGSATLMRLTLG